MPPDSNTGAGDDSQRAHRLLNDVTSDPNTVDPGEAIDLLDSPNAEIRADAAETLARLGTRHPDRVRPFISQIANHMTDDNSRVRSYVLGTLAAVANVTPEAVAPVTGDLCTLLTDDEPTVREWAALALAYVGAASPDVIEPAVPAMVDLLGDDRGAVRKNACLGLIAAGARSALPDMRALVDDPDPAVRDVVRQVLDTD